MADVLEMLKPAPAFTREVHFDIGDVVQSITEGWKMGYVLDILKTYSGRVFLAGGLVRDAVMGCDEDELPRDIDFFMRDKQLAERLAHDMAGEEDNVVETEISYKAIFLDDSPSMDFVHGIEFDSPEKLIEGFDFTITQVCMWWEDERWMAAAATPFHFHLETMTLAWAAGKNWEDTKLERVIRMYAKGFFPREEYGQSGDMTDDPDWCLHRQISKLHHKLQDQGQHIEKLHKDYQAKIAKLSIPFEERIQNLEAEVQAVKNDHGVRKEEILLERVKLKAKMWGLDADDSQSRD